MRILQKEIDWSGGETGEEKINVGGGQGVRLGRETGGEEEAKKRGWEERQEARRRPRRRRHV